MSTKRPPAILALEDGSIFRGTSFGAEGEAAGEVVFNTSLQGYQEILSDPSYRGQVVCMTYPLIGNYGVTPEDDESHRPWVEAFVVREACEIPSNHRSVESLGDYLKRTGVVGIEGIDTRALTRRLRMEGALRGVIGTGSEDADTLVDRAKALPSMEGQDLVSEVTRSEPEEWTEGHTSEFASDPRPAPDRTFNLVALDFGVKRNILRNLVDCGFNVTVVPATTSAEDVLARKPDGVFLSNGPGDPAAVKYAHETVAALVGEVPMFGICLGHQILANALGGTTYKLKFGHHGGNHPVKDLSTGKVEVTAQNHGFAVDPAIFESGEIEQTHVNLNDGTCEGMRHRDLPVFSVQYHPEAAPGPHDSLYLFDRFRTLLEERSAS
ncbi:MAG: glutamine-hydrolyzing carbamoyl-phosphate synthase small subunit [Planctomycetota bacterium]